MVNPLQPPPSNWKPELTEDARENAWRYVAGLNTDGTDKLASAHTGMRKRIHLSAKMDFILQKSARERSYEEHVFIKSVNAYKERRAISSQKWKRGNKDAITASNKIYATKNRGKRNASSKKWHGSCRTQRAASKTCR